MHERLIQKSATQWDLAGKIISKVATTCLAQNLKSKVYIPNSWIIGFILDLSGGIRDYLGRKVTILAKCIS